MTPAKKLAEIEGWPDYLISKEGMVFSKKSGRFLTPYSSRTGYWMIRLRSPQKSKIQRNFKTT